MRKRARRTGQDDDADKGDEHDDEYGTRRAWPTSTRRVRAGRSRRRRPGWITPVAGATAAGRRH
eukprot:6460575-Prymnesium_polylepis.1